MLRPVCFALAFTTMLLAGRADAQDAVANALRDSARAQERQADSLHRMETIQRDQARQADRQRINDQRDARSMRRFDR